MHKYAVPVVDALADHHHQGVWMKSSRVCTSILRQVMDQAWALGYSWREHVTSSRRMYHGALLCNKFTLLN